MRVLPVIGAVVVLVGIAFAPAIRGVAEPPEARPTFTSQLWGGLSPQGWGFTALTITNPGPPIPVAPGEAVDLTLNSIDVEHRFHLDYDGDNVSDVGEPDSGVFLPSPGGTSYSFVAPLAPGTWWYRCAQHGWDAQRGRFVVSGAVNAPPTVALTNPGGPAQTWTGGSTHTVTWTMSDPDGLPSQLLVYVNYTSSAGSGTITGPSLGIMSAPWTVPTVDVTNMVVSVDVLDPMGAKASDAQPVPTVDSTRPTVSTTVPTAGSTNVDSATLIEVTFSEAMGQAETEAALSLCEMPGCVSVPLASTGWSGNTLQMQPTSVLAANTNYQATVSTAAEDVSEPGNRLLAPHVWSFRTRNTVPSIAATQPGGGSEWTGGSTHDILWTAMDAEDPGSALTVWINYSATGAPPWNVPVAGPLPGDTTSVPWAVPADDTVTARLNFTVVDTAGGMGLFVTPPFEVDSTQPGVTLSNPAPDATGVVLNANLVVTFSERMNAVSTGDAAVVGLLDVAGGVWVPMAYTWDGLERTLTGNPVPNLATTAHYRLYVNGSARDSSDPGNAMGTAYAADFNTSSTLDLTPPRIAQTPPNGPFRVGGGAIPISATVTDPESGVQLVTIDYTDVDQVRHNLTMVPGTGSVFTFDIPPSSRPGTISYFIYAEDAVGNVNRTSTVILTVEEAVAVEGDPTPLIVGGIVLLVAVLAAVALLARRRKRHRDAGPPGGPPGA